MTGRASQPFLAQTPRSPETSGKYRSSGGANSPVLAQMVPLPGGGVGGNLRPRVAPTYRNFHPSRGET